MSRVKDGNYIVIQSWMVKDLKLKGTELLVYAIIYGFCQDDQKFTGSLQYLADWTNCSRQAIIDNLKSLCNRGLLIKSESEKNGVKFCEYQSKKLIGSQNSLPPSQESLPGGSQNSLPGGSQNSLPNNILLYSSNNNIVDNNPPQSGEPPAPRELTAYGPHNNVFITPEQYERLSAAWHDRFDYALERFSNHMFKTKTPYDNHYLTLCSWLTQDCMRGWGK